MNTVKTVKKEYVRNTGKANVLSFSLSFIYRVRYQFGKFVIEEAVQQDCMKVNNKRQWVTNGKIEGTPSIVASFDSLPLCEEYLAALPAIEQIFQRD